MSIYTTYYLNQSGHGSIGEVYRPDHFGIQRGRGLGSILGGLMRILRPLFVRGLNAIKSQAVKTGADIISDIGTKPLKQILIDRGREAKKDLTEKALNKIQTMTGTGDGIIYRGNKFAHIIQPESSRSTTPKNKRSSLLNRLKSKINSKRNKVKKKKKQKNKKDKKKSSRTLDIFT